MKADIQADGYVHVTAETPAEGFALHYIMDRQFQSQGEKSKFPVQFDTTVIAEYMVGGKGGAA